MKVGLIDVDQFSLKRAKFPNLALMKISAWHKTHGVAVDWWNGYEEYDHVYMSKVFDETYTQDMDEPLNAKEVFKGGTGYDKRLQLPLEIEHMYPDYSLYPHLTQETAFGFLTRGCCNGCPVCIVPEKEGRETRRVADLDEWWHGQKNIVLMDPNLLAYRYHRELLQQLVDSKSWVDINQGFDARFLTPENIALINQIKLKQIHFAWDYMRFEKSILRGLDMYRDLATRKPNGAFGTVYTLVNFDTTMEENLYRIYTLREKGYDPYVMIFDKPNAPKEIRDLQRWCNNRKIFKSCPNFGDYKSGR